MKAKKTLPSKEELHTLFTYEDGKLLRKKKSGNRYKVGAVVGCINPKGYYLTSIKKNQFYIHRIIYKMFHGVDAEMIDHIDNDPSNNRIENLQAVNTSQNNIKGTSARGGGITFNKACKKWIAAITIDGKYIYLGRSKDKTKALEIRREAEQKYLHNLKVA